MSKGYISLRGWLVTWAKILWTAIFKRYRPSDKNEHDNW